MPSQRLRSQGSPERPRFLLSAPPEEGQPAQLDPEELRHAQRVLRLGSGDLAWGLDGQGRAWPLIAELGPGRRPELQFRCQGPPTQEPAPGESGAALPAIELCLAWPRPGREDALLERITQLGAARLRPLLTTHTGPQDRSSRAERAQRILRQSIKQCERLWLTELCPAEAVDGIPAFRGQEVLLDPRAERGLLQTLTPWAPTGQPLRLWIGPEGGFSAGEQAAIRARAAAPARLGPHVLRIETAAEAALAVAVALAEAHASPGLGSAPPRDFGALG
jgi:16S rRNA (uracil1498-N3)-methyltransferase